MLKISFRTYSLIALFVVLFITVVIGVLIYSHREVPVKPVTPPAAQPMAYGIRLDSMEIVRGSVANNQNLSSILGAYVADGIIDRIARSTSDIFDVRKIKAGNTYARIVSKDSSRQTLYFIYEINPIDSYSSHSRHPDTYQKVLW